MEEQDARFFKKAKHAFGQGGYKAQAAEGQGQTYSLIA